MPVVDEPFESVLDADDLHPVLEHGLFRHGPDDGVDARAVAAAGQDRDPLLLDRTHLSLSRSP